MKLELCRQIFGKSSNIKFHENLSSGSRIVPCGHTQTQTHGQTDMTKLIVSFCIFTNAHNNENPPFCVHGVFMSFLQFFPLFAFRWFALFDGIFSLRKELDLYMSCTLILIFKRFVIWWRNSFVLFRSFAWSWPLPPSLRLLLERLVPIKDPSYRSYGLILSMVSHESKFTDWAIKTAQWHPWPIFPAMYAAGLAASFLHAAAVWSLCKDNISESNVGSSACWANRR
jgi:hypothetical protein